MDKTAEVLARLREERARLAGELAGVERAIAALEAAVEEPAAVARSVPEPARPPIAAAPPPRPAPPLPPPPDPPPGPYAPLGFYGAAAMYLREAAEPRTVRQIADALLAGGYRTTAKNFLSVARTMLQRSDGFTPPGIRSTSDGSRWYVMTPDRDATS